MKKEKERDIGLLLKQINKQIKKRFDKDLQEYDLTLSQSRVLFFLGFREEEKTSLKDIEEHLQVTHPTVVGIVKRLEEKGFVITESDSADRRVKLVFITEKTKGMIQNIDKRGKMMDKKLLKGFSDQEIRELRRMLSIIEHNLEEDTIC